MSDRIFVTGLVIHAYHGVLAHEGQVGQAFILDLLLDVDLSAAARSDKLADTIGYDSVVAIASGAFQGQRHRLIEAAAGAVAQALLEAFRQVERVQVTVRKPHAPIAAVFTDVGVTLTRVRHG